LRIRLERAQCSGCAPGYASESPSSTEKRWKDRSPFARAVDRARCSFQPSRSQHGRQCRHGRGSGRGHAAPALRAFFAENDGGLPEVQIIDITPAEAQRSFESLLTIAAPLRLDQVTWDSVADEDLPIRDLPEPALLAATGRLPALHVVLERLRWDGGAIPDLGVSVWPPGDVALDYRPGPDWTSATMSRFISLLDSLIGLTQGGALVLADEASRPLPRKQQDQFLAAINEYRRRA
jgi:hypothetical protein